MNPRVKSEHAGTDPAERCGDIDPTHDVEAVVRTLETGEIGPSRDFVAHIGVLEASSRASTKIIRDAVKRDGVFHNE